MHVMPCRQDDSLGDCRIGKVGKCVAVAGRQLNSVLELVRTKPSGEKIAETAQAFGQEDDISVISVTRVPVA
jgi:hypothetical protein